MRPIKWKGILSGLTFCYWKGDPSDPAQSTSLNMCENWKKWKFLKNRSLKYFLLSRSCLVMPFTIQIHKKTQSNIEAHLKCRWDNGVLLLAFICAFSAEFYARRILWRNDVTESKCHNVFCILQFWTCKLWL